MDSRQTLWRKPWSVSLHYSAPDSGKSNITSSQDSPFQPENALADVRSLAEPAEPQLQTGPLQLRTSDINVPPATPVKRRGKSMSRRTGQKGHIEPSGRWWVVRWWMDVPEQEERRHMRERICPISGPGTLSKSERKRRAREIVVESGADTKEYFQKVVKKKGGGTTFREQAQRWFNHVQNRRRKPLALSTLELWEGCLKNWINPYIGDLSLSEINNAALKPLVAKMVEGGLSPKSIDTYSQVVKMVVASAVNDEGEEIYPRKWNHEFIDMPIVEEEKQNTPTFSSEVMTGLASWKKERERMIFILCGAAGLRIGEALGIEINKHVSHDFLTISIAQKIHHGRVEQRLKTANGGRQVDLHPAIAALFQEFVGDRATGFLFCTQAGRPLSPSNIIRRHLHKALKELNYVNPHTGTHKAGNHAFRRFRNTYLRNKTQCPEGLRNYWMGHKGNSMDDLYDKIKEDVQFRKKWAEQCGFGFELPSVVPSVPKSTENSEAAVAT
jgi:integrase